MELEASFLKKYLEESFKHDKFVFISKKILSFVFLLFASSVVSCLNIEYTDIITLLILPISFWIGNTIMDIVNFIKNIHMMKKNVLYMDNKDLLNKEKDLTINDIYTISLKDLKKLINETSLMNKKEKLTEKILEDDYEEEPILTKDLGPRLIRRRK